MNPIIHPLTRLNSVVPVVASTAAICARPLPAASVRGVAALVAVLALALGAAPVQGARAKYESHTVAIALSGEKLPDHVQVAGPISRMPTVSTGKATDRSHGASYGDVLLSGPLPVPERLETWFATMEAGMDARNTLSIELTNHSRDLVCSWEVIEAIPYKLEVVLQGAESSWTLHISTQLIRYSGPGSKAKTSANASRTATKSGTATQTSDASASRTQQRDGKERPAGSTGANAAGTRTQRNTSATRTIGAGSIDPRDTGSAPVIRQPAPSQDKKSGYIVTTADGNVHEVANIIPSDDRKQIILVMADQKRVTFDRSQIKKIDRLAER